MSAQLSLRAVLLASAAISTTLPAFGQDVFELDTVLLAESQREVATQTAVSSTTVDEDEIIARQADTIAEIVDTVPGVRLINGNTPQGSGINIRGLGANSTYGSDQKVAIQLDGASVGSEELYRIGTQLYTDPSFYKEVEVIRGIAGTFEYGSGIIGGLVRAESRDAIDLTEGETGFAFRQSFDFGTNGNQWASSSIAAWQPTENLGFIGNFTYRGQGIMTDGSGNPINVQPSETPSYTLGALYRFGSDNQHALRATYADTNSVENDVPYDSFGTSGGSFGNVDRAVHSRTATLRYTFDSTATDWVNVTALLSYADQQIDSAYVSGSSPMEGTPSFPFLQPLVDADHRYQTTKLTVKNQAFFTTGAFSHDLRFGVEGIYKKRLDASSAPGGTDKRFAMFAVDDISMGGLTVTPALRYERQVVGGPSYAYYNNDAFMGGISGRYEFGSSGFAVFGSAAYTENLPIMDDLTNPAYMTQSEKARSYELGLSLDRASVFTGGDQLSVKVNAYQTNLWDITSYTSPTMTPYVSAQMRGVELEASYSTASGFYTDVNANLQYGTGQDASGASTDWAGIPASQLRATFGKRWGNEYDLSWEIVADAAMNRSATPTPSSIVHNVRATYIPQEGLFEGAEFRLGVENLFDLDYTPHLATRSAPGRTFKFNLAKTF